MMEAVPMMQVQPTMYELVFIHRHTNLTTGSYTVLYDVQSQHYSLYCHVIQIKLSRTNVCLTTKGENLFIETMNRCHMEVFHKAMNHVTQ
jgi:hypothetical protein